MAPLETSPGKGRVRRKDGKRAMHQHALCPNCLLTVLVAVWVACARTSHGISTRVSVGGAERIRVTLLEPRFGTTIKSSGAGGRILWRPTLELRGGAEGHDSDLSLDHSGTTLSQDLSLFEAPRGDSLHGGTSEGEDDAQVLRAQIVKLMVQAMDEYGFPESARSLERESGIALHDSAAVEALNLQASIRSGDWASVNDTLECVRWVDDRARFTIYRQMYLGLLHADQAGEAARFLEAKLRPCSRTLPGAYQKEMGRLRIHLVSPRQEIPAMASASSRAQLADQVMEMAPSDVLLPSNRLEHLLRQSLRYQELQALYPYTKSTRLNLAEDLTFDETKLPYLCTEIRFHSDEVWVCKFSPSGRWLATAGKDHTLCIWSTPALCSRGSASSTADASQQSALAVCIEAQMAVCAITWSSDESIVVAAGWEDAHARAWYVPTGMPAQALAPLHRSLCAVEWVVGHWLCAGGGGDEVILLWKIEPGASGGSAMATPPDPVARLATGGRSVISLSCSSDGKQLVALLAGQCLRFFDLDRITKALEDERNDAPLEGLSCKEPTWMEQSPAAAAGHLLSARSPDGAKDARTSQNAGCGDAAEADPASLPPEALVSSNLRAIRGDGSFVFANAIEERAANAHAYLASAPYDHVRVFECFREIQEPVAGMSFLTSALVAGPLACDRVLLSCVSMYGEPVIVEWDTGCLKVRQTFRGHRMERFVTGMTAGGPADALVSAGSEDGSILLWQRESGRPVKLLSGHQGAVNSLAWCVLGAAGRPAEDEGPSNVTPPYLFASASDDQTVRVWRPLPASSPSLPARGGKAAGPGRDEQHGGTYGGCRLGSPIAPDRKVGRK